MNPRENYDLSATQKIILEHRNKRRAVLRQQYLQHTLHPFNFHPSGYTNVLSDPAITRLMEARINQKDFFIPTLRNAILFMCTGVLPILVLGYFVVKDRESQEHQIRTGQISYRDRYKKY